MDVLDFINRNGQRTVPNPNYNPRSKKNTEPPTIIVPDAQPISDDVIEMAKRDALNQFSIASGTADKYREFGLNYNPKENLDKQLADVQSNWSKAINALGQTLVSEIGIGTVKGVSDLIDFVGQKVGLSDHNYSNPVSQYLEEKQKEFEEWAPIYTDPDNNTMASQFTGGFNLGYWFSNIPSIASSLTLLIPSTGITKGLSWAGKASKISKYTNRAARAIANPVAHAFGRSGFTSAEMGVAFETGINAALSRTMENYQEARQTYNDTYVNMSSSLRGMSQEEYTNFVNRNADYLEDSGIDVNDRDAVAKQIARTSADRTFQLDFANVIFDAYQIYGLRNMLTHAPRFNGSAATRRAQRESIRTVGMTEEQAAAELAKDPKWAKAGHWFGDRFIGAGRQIKSELSEGVEEAVNYIAQQEGTHLGKYILSGEEGSPEDMELLSSLGPMGRRILNDYINDAGLWDSAFWGVLGGVVFQGGGNALNRVSQTIKNRQNAKKSANKDNDKTKEAKLTPHWWQLDQLSETERMIGDIKGRNVKLETFKSAMRQINSGKNPYIKKEDGTQQDISSPVEERMLREKAYTEYLDELIINARNNGTLRMLDSYLQDENVREAIVQAYMEGDANNKISKEEAEAAAAKASERVKKIDNLYQNEIIHASDIADKIADRKGVSLPAEYVQMIASANVRHRLNLERYDEVAALYNEDTERIKQVVDEKFDPAIDYKGMISLKTTIQELSNLIAERKELEAQQVEHPTLTRQFDIEELDTQIDVIKRKALKTSTEAQFARTLYALQVADSAIREYSPDGKQFKVTTSDLDLITNLDQMLVSDLSYVFDETGQEKREVSAEAVVGELRKITNDMRYVLPTDSNNKLQDTSQYLDSIAPKLSENYDILSRIELEKIKEQAKLAETESEITHYVDAINNIENVARKQEIEEQFMNLAQIQRKHKDMDLLYVMNNIYNDSNTADFLVDTNGLTEEERDKIKEAAKVLNMADVKNRDLFDRLSKGLILIQATQAQVDANDKQNTEGAENSFASQNSNSAQQTGQLINQLASAQQQATGQGNGQIGGVSIQNIPKFVTITQAQNGTLTTTSVENQNVPGAIPVRYLGIGNFELTFSAINNSQLPGLISNTTLFELEQTPMDGATVTRDPIVKFKTNGEIEVIAKGLVQNPVKSNVREDVVNAAVNEINNNISLKYKLNSLSFKTKKEAVNSIKATYGLNDDEVNQILGKVNITTSVSSTGEGIQSAQSYIDRMNNSHDSKEVDTIFTEGLNAGIPEKDLFPTYSKRQKEIEEEKKEKEFKGPEAPVRGADPLDYIPKISGAARQAALDLKDGKEVTYETYLASLSDIRAVINNDEEFERLSKESWNRAMQRLAKKYPEIVDTLINSLQSSTTEEAPESRLGYRFKTSFKKEVEKLVKAYLKDIGQKKSNGKYVISLENLLRYCNGEFQNNENAELLYNVLSNYLLSEEASSTYEIIEVDKNSEDPNAFIRDPHFLDKVKTPIEERIEKAIKDENHRINTIEIKDKTVFDQLEQGQELDVVRDTSKDRIYFEFDGKRVGYIGIPRVKNNTYSSPYGYFMFRIKPEGKDTYSSRLADIFKAIANAEEGELKEIKDAALVGGISLKDNKTWQAIKDQYAINTVDSETGEEYDEVDNNMLQTIRTMASFAVRYGSADQAIDAWFNNLVQEYVAANELAQNKDAKVVVDTITDGFLIRATDRLTDGSGNLVQSEIDKLPLASKAIGRNSKGKVSIGVGSRQNPGTIETVVKKENNKVTIPASNSLPGVGYSNSFVVFPLSQGKTAYAQAYPITAKELKAGSPAAKIVGAFANQINKYIEAIANNPSDTQLLKELQDFLFEALNYKNDTTPLFHMDNCEKIGVGDSRGTHIGNNDRRGHRSDLRIFCNPGKVHKIQINDETFELNRTNIATISNKVRQFIGTNLKFNIAENYIASDNNKRNQVTGLATRDRDGKFVVKIGDEIFIFDSYNDFILDNDLVRVNTIPNEHGNNVTRTSFNPNVRYKIVTSSPVERNVTRQSATVDVAKEANNIMSSSRTDKAAALARLVFDDNIVTTLSIYDLLPHNLVFDAAFNTGDNREKLNASFNTTTKVTTIGPKFMAMLSNPNEAYRKQAIRKLIHERLHDVIHSNGNEHYVKDIKAIYDTFVSYIDDENFSKPILEKYLKKINSNKYLDEFYDNFKKYKYLSKQTEEERLEEFLVDSLTSVELADFLNNITSLSKVNMREKKRDTLLNKIMRVLAKLMGINIKNDSLYAQEFETLRQAINSNAQLTLQFENETNVKQKQETETENENVTKDTPEEVSTQEPENKNGYKIVDETSDDDEYSSTTEEYSQNDYTQEMNNIKKRAIADGIFMKAPNGNPTNLTERQWLQVRTKEFKNWFGDWINNPNNASKVVDENGEPLVVYHGSDKYGFNIFDPSKADDKISLFTSSSKWIASTYTSFKPLENALVRKALLKGNAIDLIKNEDWKSLEKLINSVIDFNLVRPIEGGYPLPYGNEKVLDEILTIRKELDNPNLTEKERLALLADLTKAEDKYYYSGNYTFRIKQKSSVSGKSIVEISIDDQYSKMFSSHFIEEGVIFRGNPEELIDSLTFDTKVYDLFLNIKNPLILDNQVNDFGHANNWNGLDFSPAAKEVQNTDLWGNKMPGTHKQTKTRDVAEYAKNNNYDGVIFKQIADKGGYPGYRSLNPITDADYLYEDMHIGEDSFNATNKLKSDVFIAFDSNQIKSAIDNIGTFNTKDDNIYNSDTTEEYESVASIGDYIWSYSPEDRAEIAREINNGNISIKCK